MLTSSLWWSDVWHTVFITVVSVALELALGMVLALIMHRAIFGRGAVRTAALIPYGIVTVVAAFAWRLASSQAEGGFVPVVLGIETDPLTSTSWTYVVAIIAEVWKTTPFMALLLLAGPRARPRRAAGGGQGRRRDAPGSASGGSRCR